MVCEGSRDGAGGFSEWSWTDVVGGPFLYFGKYRSWDSELNLLKPATPAQYQSDEIHTGDIDKVTTQST